MSLLPGPEADEGLDPLVDRVGAPIGNRCGAIEMIGFGKEGDFGVRVPGGEFVGEFRDEGDRVLGEEVSDVGDDEIVVGFSLNGERVRGDYDSLGGVSEKVIACSKSVFHECVVFVPVVV